MYYKLITKKNNKYNKINITENFIINLLKKIYNQCAFSTFSYIFNNFNSKQSIKKFNSGDCVALSMYIINLLKKKNIISFLIPATIPIKYKLPDYLNISHVALAIPLFNNKYFIIDPAFYFIKPILVNINTNKFNKIIPTKNIYTDSVEYLKYKTYILNENYKFNDYQLINKNTHFIECSYTNNISDKWIYFITEIINPDKAISTFFINIKHTPFITTTITNDNNICKLNYYLKIENNLIIFKKFNKTIFSKNIIDITKEDIKYVDTLLFRYFKGNFYKYIKKYKYFINNNKLIIIND